MNDSVRRPLFFSRSPPKGPRGHRAYVIGDVHGRLDLLDWLLERIEADIRTGPKRKTSIVFLGDLIDRGPSSAEVLERLRTFQPSFAKTLFLMGNHEEVFLRILDGDTSLIPSWLRFGGAETLTSYGLDPVEFARAGDAEAVARLRRVVPESHSAFISTFADTVSFGDYLFVHAGIRPGVELSEQSKSDLRWIREPFLNDEGERDYVVVHGHTIRPDVEITSNRIGIDTGAFYTGVLTALAIEGDRCWSIQTDTEKVRSEPLSPA